MKDETFTAGVLNSLSSEEINTIEDFRKSKQTALLTILFSDVVNSSYATEKLGEETYSRLRHIHDEIFTRIMCRENAGIIIKQIGDSFLCVFAEPSAAVIRAIEFQRAIYANKQHFTVNGYTLTVRIGINLGQVVVENTLAMDIFGTHVNRAARIESIANGGQTITSQSVWENTAGWLTDHSDKNIGWVAYGKVRLKGINKPVEVFGFYAKELNKPKAPVLIYKQRQKQKTILTMCILAFVLGLAFLIKELSNTRNVAVQPDTRRTYYVQFDFSGLKDSVKQLGIDTVAMEDDLLTQVIALLSPDSVITEQDLVTKFSKQGKIYHRHGSNDPNIDTIGFFSDSLYLRGSLFIKATQPSKPVKDSQTLVTTFVLYEKNDSSSGTRAVEWDKLYSLSNTGKDFREKLMDILLYTRKWDMQAYVVSSDEGVLVFHTTSKAQLRQGTALRFVRRYKPGKEGLLKRLDDIKSSLDFYRKNPAYLDYVKDLTEEKTEIDSLLKINNGKEADYGGIGMAIAGKVLDMYDSTGTATWHTTEPFPEKLKPGDEIYYK